MLKQFWSRLSKKKIYNILFTNLFSCISGGYVNPAITLGFCLSGRIPWKKFPVFVPAQFAGAFTAAAVNYGLYLGMKRKKEVNLLSPMTKAPTPTETSKK